MDFQRFQTKQLAVMSSGWGVKPCLPREKVVSLPSVYTLLYMQYLDQPYLLEKSKMAE